MLRALATLATTATVAASAAALAKPEPAAVADAVASAADVRVHESGWHTRLLGCVQPWLGHHQQQLRRQQWQHLPANGIRQRHLPDHRQQRRALQLRRARPRWLWCAACRMLQLQRRVRAHGDPRGHVQNHRRGLLLLLLVPRVRPHQPKHAATQPVAVAAASDPALSLAATTLAAAVAAAATLAAALAAVASTISATVSAATLTQSLAVAAAARHPVAAAARRTQSAAAHTTAAAESLAVFAGVSVRRQVRRSGAWRLGLQRRL